MDNNKEKLKKYAINSPINTELDRIDIGLELKTSIEAFQEGSFPENTLNL